ncbi:MAG TPA: FHA domain-containing protein [Kofleriaceae bacterium]|jgi:pSer/pThr/pTyr-binding forkhead associated (FHA) protein|nr:FHA domain-containing protein [Kofleriaceae bacterium]
MATCLRCGDPVPVGALCREHAHELATCEDITAEQVSAQASPAPAAWLIDQWGRAHGFGFPALVGRSADECVIAVLHHTVSAIHAQLRRDGDALRVHDRGSLNGTFVNGVRIRESLLAHGDLLGFGEVRFYLSTREVPAITIEGGPGRTSPSRADEIMLSVVLRSGDRRLELIERPGGGVARVGDQAVELAALEFSLLRELVERRRGGGDPERSFVAYQELSSSLDFKSLAADSDNVRELVRRVRRKLDAAGVTDLIESRQRVGYRLAWDIEGGPRV